MTTWFTSDLHLGHANILTYCPNRPFADSDTMGEHLVATWNETVHPDDDVIVVGDVCMGTIERSLDLIGALHGRTITLVVGNHDRPFRRNGTPRPDWERRYRDAGFTNIVHGETTVDIGLPDPARVCHFPFHGDSRGEERYGNHRPADPGHGFLLHGHCHGIYRRNGRMVDVGVDAWGGRPVSTTELVELLTGPDDVVPPLPWRQRT